MRNAYLFEYQNPRTKRYGLCCITYRVSQISQIFAIETRDSISLKMFNHKIKTWYSKCNHYIFFFSVGLIYANILENFNLMLDQLQWASTFDLV